jgi:hypothetical protein
MIITKIQGGLGNQMFQYAFGRMLALRNNTELKLDVTMFKTYEFHLYTMDSLNITAPEATKEEIGAFLKFAPRAGRMGKILNPFLANGKKYYKEPEFTFNAKNMEVKAPVMVDGYWQSEKYFLEIEDTIRKEFTLKKPLNDYSKSIAEKIMAAREPVALHIRRGDFAYHPYMSKVMGICPPEYYDEAKKIIKERVAEPTYFVFSDDPEWTRANMQTGFPTEYIGQGPEINYMDLELMRLCKHHILSNSTFGWWGAWLSDHSRTGVNIAPMRWTNKNFDGRDLIPQYWITLPY